MKFDSWIPPDFDDDDLGAFIFKWAICKMLKDLAKRFFQGLKSRVEKSKISQENEQEKKD